MSTAPTRNTYNIARGHALPQATIIAVGGGKGGIGKSFFSSSLAIFLSHLGHDTHLIDLDLGAANLHTCLGENVNQLGINEFLTDPSLSLRDVSAQTRFPKLKLISGSSDALEAADISDFQRSRLMSSLYKLNSRFIVVDLSAGSHHTTLDFFMMATRKIVVFTPEPSSIENAYRFLKAGFHRKIRRFEAQLQIQDLISELMSHRIKHGIRSPGDLLRVIREKSPAAGQELSNYMQGLNVDIVLNQVRTIKDAELGPSIQGVCSKYFGIPANYLGAIDYDNAVWQSLRKRRHLLVEHPHSRIYAQMMAIARRLVATQPQRAMIG